MLAWDQPATRQAHGNAVIRVQAVPGGHQHLHHLQSGKARALLFTLSSAGVAVVGGLSIREWAVMVASPGQALRA